MAEEQEKQFSIQKIYTRNISFESPNAPEIFTQEFQPQLDVDMNVETSALEEGIYHAVVRVTATTKVDDKTAFLCEVEQAGIFGISGFDDNELSYLLGTQCPNTLFPYAREAISEMVTRGGFPQLLLEPVNFDAMYASHLQQQETQQ
jgi:preprotein translocase subunit SecB